MKNQDRVVTLRGYNSTIKSKIEVLDNMISQSFQEWKENGQPEELNFVYETLLDTRNQLRGQITKNNEEIISRTLNPSRYESEEL